MTDLNNLKLLKDLSVPNSEGSVDLGRSGAPWPLTAVGLRAGHGGLAVAASPRGGAN